MRQLTPKPCVRDLYRLINEWHSESEGEADGKVAVGYPSSVRVIFHLSIKAKECFR